VGRVWIRCLLVIDGIDERCWGVFTKCKRGGRKKVRYAKKKEKRKIARHSQE